MRSTRREWLATAAGGATLGAQSAKVRIAFLGISHSHGAGKLAVVRANPAFEVAGFWEADPWLSTKTKESGVARLTREQILEDRSITAVAVESEVWDHAADAEAALTAGKHVHVEKPPADTKAAWLRIRKLAADKKLVLQSGYMWRYHPGVAKVFEAVRQGWLGQVYLVRGVMNTQIDAGRRKDWARFAGGDMFEQGAHLIDFQVRLMGRPERVTSFLKRTQADALKDNTAAVLEWKNGALGIVQAATLQPDSSRHRTLEVMGTKGTAILRPIEPGALVIDLAEAAGPYQKGANTVPLPKYERYVDDFVDLAQAIRTGQPLRATLEEEAAVQETLLLASGQP